MANASTSITISYNDGTGGDVGTEPKDVTLKIIDYCDATAITSATVTVSGNGFSWSGPPDSQGLCALGVLQPGSYSLTITASGYVNSADDLLANDGFVV